MIAPIGMLKARSRRGMKELDVVLERWLVRDLPHADDGTKEAYARLLELQDPDLMQLIFADRVHPDPALAALVADIRRPL